MARKRSRKIASKVSECGHKDLAEKFVKSKVTASQGASGDIRNARVGQSSSDVHATVMPTLIADKSTNTLRKRTKSVAFTSVEMEEEEDDFYGTNGVKQEEAVNGQEQDDESEEMEEDSDSDVEIKLESDKPIRKEETP